MERRQALFILILAELWERFSYYGMRAILVLYLTRAANFEDGDALRLYGAYLALLYALPVLGGALADQVLGARRAVYGGAVVLVLGHALLTLDGAQLASALPFSPLYLALALIGVGTGLLKANISTLVGMLYEKKDPERDGAYSWFYLGINLGAFTAALSVGYVGERLGWHWGFALAGLGMLVGLGVLLLGRDRLAGLGDPPATPTVSRPVLLLTALLALPVAYQLLRSPPLMGGVLALVGVGAVGFALFLAFRRLPREARHDTLLMLSLIGFSIIFWFLFEQAGGALNLFTDRFVDRRVGDSVVPASQLQSLNAFFIIVFAPLFARLWPWLARRGYAPGLARQFALALVLAGVGFALLARPGSGADYVPLWALVGAYLFHTLGELCLSPVGLAMVTRLAVPQLVGMMMGVWFLAISAAGYLSGMFAETLVSADSGAGMEGFLQGFERLAWLAVVAGLGLWGLARLRFFKPSDEGGLPPHTDR
jgi:POT family proton-dependent oligopeptide transporter